MSRKSRGRSASRDAGTLTESPLAPGSPLEPEPAVFRDMVIEEGRISDGRRIIYFSWPGGAPEVPAPGEAVPAAAPEVEPMVELAGDAPAPAPLPAPPEAPSLAELPAPPELPSADEDWAAADLPPEDEGAADV